MNELIDSNELKTLPMQEVEKKLDSSPNGLTQAEAEKRLSQYGLNAIVEKKTHLFLKFFSYFVKTKSKINYEEQNLI